MECRRNGLIQYDRSIAVLFCAEGYILSGNSQCQFHIVMMRIVIANWVNVISLKSMLKTVINLWMDNKSRKQILMGATKWMETVRRG